MNKKVIAHCIHHTHWDPFWYFTSQDAMVVFCYNVKEMLRAFEEGKIQDFFLDGQTAAIDEYLTVHPEDENRIRELVASEKLAIGPFVSQLDPFISCGESVINNLRLGIQHAKNLGKCSKIAYLADPFGHPTDFPKIFNQFGIHDFVLTRGVGDIYSLGTEFYFESNDRSRVLCHVMLAGYGYGAYAFMKKTLFTQQAEDYNKIDVDSLIRRLLERSTLENEFVFPLGFDQNPVMLHIPELIEYYKQKKPDFEFRYTTWKDFFSRVREHGKDVRTVREELLSPQYHRLHLSGMNSARADIKTVLDQAERSLTYETKPLMSMLDALGIPYDHGIVDRAWYTLVNCQTHASATHIDATNRWIKEQGLAALNYSQAATIYLMRLVAVSLEEGVPETTDLVVFNTIPWTRKLIHELTIVTRSPSFELLDNGERVTYSVVRQEHVYGGVIRRNTADMTENNWFYRTTITADLGTMEGIAYKTLQIRDVREEPNSAAEMDSSKRSISNERYSIEYSTDGIRIHDRELGITFENVFYLEDSGDEGDSYDYSYPDADMEMIITEHFESAQVGCVQTPELGRMRIEGEFLAPASLEERAEHRKSVPLHYRIEFELESGSSTIRIRGSIHNQAINHRIRLGIRTGIPSAFSYAGTHFGYVKRPCDPPEMEHWREKEFFEEPCSTRALLNHVSAVGQDRTFTVFTRGVKEYQFIGEEYSEISLTLFRSVGYVGLPDLNRRPGRPSGLSNKLFESPDHQMLGKNEFEIGICIYPRFDANKIMRDYAEYAVDPLYFQNQGLDKTSIPISYFPINPFEKRLPRDYQFIHLENFTGSYGTVTKADNHDGYILRLFNSETTKLADGELRLGFDYDQVVHVNLLEEHMADDDRSPTALEAGELKNLLLLRRD